MALSVRRMLFSELIFWIVLCGVGLYLLYPLRQSLRFGIDLVGGTYLTLEVEVDKAVDAELVSKLQIIESKLKLARKLPTSKVVEKEAIIFRSDDYDRALRPQADGKDWTQRLI